MRQENDGPKADLHFEERAAYPVALLVYPVELANLGSFRNGKFFSAFFQRQHFPFSFGAPINIFRIRINQKHLFDILGFVRSTLILSPDFSKRPEETGILPFPNCWLTKL